MIANVSKTNNGKRLMAAVIAFVMVACAVAVIASPVNAADANTPIEADTGLDYGKSIDMNQDAWDALKTDKQVEGATTSYVSANKVVKLEANQTWNLTGNVTDADVTLDLNGYNLKITGKYTLSLTNNAADDNGGYIATLTNESETKANIMIDGSTVTFIGNGTRTGGVWAVDATDLNQIYLVNGATLNVSKTSTSAVTGTVWCGDNGTPVIFVDGSSVNFSNAHENGAGVSMTAIYAYNNSTVDSTGLNGGSLSIYADLKDSTIVGDTVGLYAATMSGDSEIKADTLGVYSGSAEAGFSGFTTKSVEIGSGSEINATTIINSLTAGTASKNQQISISGNGTISGNFTEIAKTESNYSLSGVTVSGGAAAGANIAVGANGVSFGNFTAAEDSTIALGSNEARILAGASVDISKANITASSGKIVVGEGSTASLPAKSSDYSVSAVSDNPKITFNGTPAVEGDYSSYEPSVTSQDALEQAIALGVTEITIDGAFDLTGDLTIPAGVAITGGENAITLGTYSIIGNGGTYNGKVVAGTNTVAVELAGTYCVSADTNNVVLSGAISSKVTVDASANNIVLKDLNITSSGSLYLAGGDDGATVASIGTVSLYGKLMSSDGNNVTIEVASKANFRAYGGSTIQDKIVVQPADKVTDANINIDGAMYTLTINDDINSSNIYGQTQTVVIGSTLDIVSGTTVIINGQFVVNEGVTLTIQSGATLIINGTSSVLDVNGNIIIEDDGTLQVSNSKSVDIAGSVQVYGTLDIDNGTVTVQENGNITVAVEGTIDVADASAVEIKTGATLDILGAFTIGKITNAGSINMTGAVINGNSNITLANGGAVNVSSYTVGTTGALKITDGQNTITFTANTLKTGFSGAVITTASEKVNNVDTFTMSVSGSIGIVNNTDKEEVTASVDISGTKVAVTGDLTVGERVTVKNNAKLVVSGTVTATAGTFDNTSGTIDVTGTITTKANGTNTIGGIVNGAYYNTEAVGTTPATTVYTTFEDAVQSGATRVFVGVGAATVTASEGVTVPATVTSLTINSGAVLNIGAADNRDITVTIADGCNVTGTIEVYATLTFENNRNVRGTVNSDVVIDDEPARTYTNLYTALASGAETVTVARNVTLTSNIEIPQGVTLVVPAGTGITFNAGVTMTVNGAVQTAVDLTGPANGFDEKSASNTEDKKTARIVVNGKFMTSVTGKTAEAMYNQYKIAGAYYNISDSTGAFLVIEPVANAAANAASATNGIDIRGENAVNGVAFNGTKDKTLAVAINGKVSGDISLNYATLDINAQYDGTVSTATGAVELVNVTGVDIASVYKDVNGTAVESMTVSGQPAKANAEGAAPAMTVASGEVTVPAAGLTIDSQTANKVTTNVVALAVAEGATMAVNGQLSAYDITVYGEIVSVNGGNVKLTEAFVFGTLTVAKDDTAAKITAGTASIGTLYVGLDKKYDNITAAAVNGTVSGVELMVVASQATVAQEFIDTFAESTAFNVEGSVWFTAYATSNTKIVTVDSVKVQDALFIGWAEKADGEPIEATGSTDEKPVYEFDFSVGQYETLYAIIDYEIYTVTITADGGIGTVAIDGKVLVKTGNQFIISGLKAGTHTIDYIVNAGFEGTPTISVNGTAITGNSFTLSGTSDADRNVSISIYGTQPSTSTGGSTTSGGDDGLGLTDILLIILVVLIVIMAVIVALRLMRS